MPTTGEIKMQTPSTLNEYRQAYAELLQSHDAIEATLRAEAMNRRALAEAVMHYNDVPYDSPESDERLFRMIELAEGMTK